MATTAGSLVVVNLLAINLSALLVFSFAGYRPVPGDSRDLSAIRRSVRKRLGGIVLGLLLLSVVLGTVTYAEYRTNEVELQLRDETRAMLEEPEYEGLNYEGAPPTSTTSSTPSGRNTRSRSPSASSEGRPRPLISPSASTTD